LYLKITDTNLSIKLINKQQDTIYVVKAPEPPRFNPFFSSSEISYEERTCLLDAMLGEQGGETDYEKITFLFFFDAQSKRFGRGYCEEFYAIEGGGARRYSATSRHHLNRIANKKKKVEFIKHNLQIINDFLDGKLLPDEVQTAVTTTTNCLQTSFSKSNKAPSWHKDYLITQIRVGNTIYSRYDWSRKNGFWRELRYMDLDWVDVASYGSILKSS